MDSAASGGTDKACALWVLRRCWRKQATAALRAGQHDGWVPWGDCPDLSELQFSHLYDTNGVCLRGLWRELNETGEGAQQVLQVELCLQNSYVAILTPSTSEYGCIWR